MSNNSLEQTVKKCTPQCPEVGSCNAYHEDYDCPFEEGYDWREYVKKTTNDSSDGTKKPQPLGFKHGVNEHTIIPCGRCETPTPYGELYPLLNCEATVVKHLCSRCYEEASVVIY